MIESCNSSFGSALKPVSFCASNMTFPNFGADSVRVAASSVQ